MLTKTHISSRQWFDGKIVQGNAGAIVALRVLGEHAIRLCLKHVAGVATPGKNGSAKEMTNGWRK
jgi:hypothetical protein